METMSLTPVTNNAFGETTLTIPPNGRERISGRGTSLYWELSTTGLLKVFLGESVNGIETTDRNGIELGSGADGGAQIYFDFFEVENLSAEPVTVRLTWLMGRLDMDGDAARTTANKLSAGGIQVNVDAIQFPATQQVSAKPLTRVTRTGDLQKAGNSVTKILDIATQSNVKSVFVQVANILQDGVTGGGAVTLSGSPNTNPIEPEFVVMPGQAFEITDEHRDLYLHNENTARFWVTVKEY